MKPDQSTSRSILSAKKLSEETFAGPVAGEELVECAARTLYDTDEDILDEAILTRWSRSKRSLQEQNYPRLSWLELSDPLREAYRRRARACMAAVQAWSQPIGT